MSKRWFILAFSILFFFAFRAWMDDISLSDNPNSSDINAEEITLDTKAKLLIFPASMNNDIRNAIELKLIQLPDKYENTPDIIPFDGKESLYIFPTWPDRLIVDFEEVVVNNNPFPALRGDSSF